jgi:uncharacterized membrane protein (DUF106 family)
LVSETLKKQIDRFLLAFGFSLMFGIMILGQNFRQTVGEAVGVLMNPVLALVGQENFHLVLLVMAAITAIYASLIQKYTIDWDLMRNTQERMKIFQKEFREAQLSQNTYMLKKLEDQRKDTLYRKENSELETFCRHNVYLSHLFNIQTDNCVWL